MPRTARSIEGGLIYHVLNRGNGRMNLFHKDADFSAFQAVLAEGIKRYPVELLTYCLMDNHWHLVVRPTTDEALGRLMGWVCVTHVRRHHAHYHSRGGGHLYQGRFKSFPVQEDGYFLTLCRYVEANAVRAKAVADAASWRWSGAYDRLHRNKVLELAKWPVDRPRNWMALLNDPMDEKKIGEVRTSVTRGRPFGEASWVGSMAERLSLQYTMREAGRPRKVGN